MIFPSVVFPLPFGPDTAITSPVFNEILADFKILFLEALYRNEIFSQISLCISKLLDFSS